MAGRPKRIDTEEDRARLKRQGEVLRQYRESDHCAIIVLGDSRFDDERRHPYPSREQFGDHYGIAKATQARYEEGKTGLPDEIAKALERDTGIVSKHWQGYVGRMTPSAYDTFVSENEGLRNASGEYQKELEACTQRREQFFACVGFKYIYESPSAAQDFGNAPLGSHVLIRQINPADRYRFTDMELDALMEKIQGTVGFACYEKEMKKEA